MLLVPLVVSCRPKEPAAAAKDQLPRVREPSWDAIAFNRARGNAGAIPESYRGKINGPDGVAQHLGKHLPFVPKLPSTVPVPAGMMALMWGDPALGHARHPNAPVSPALPTGHWYDWIRVRRATDREAEERESRFSSWPHASPADRGQLVALAGEDPAADEGRNTVYVVALPEATQPGEWVRIHAHCLTHGEYVDFVRVPG